MELIRKWRQKRLRKAIGRKCLREYILGCTGGQYNSASEAQHEDVEAVLVKGLPTIVSCSSGKSMEELHKDMTTSFANLKVSW